MSEWQHNLARILCESPLALRAPAKVNLRLKIEGRRDDGMHLLSMIICPIGLSDEIRIEFLQEDRAARSLSVSGLADLDGGVIEVERNLLTRAILQGLAVCELHLGFAAALDKRVPTRAGLGGGSSDAGSLLRYLIDAAMRAGAPHWTIEALAALAPALGADVPFFLEPRLSAVRGIGDVLTPLNANFGASSIPILLVVPRAGLESGPVFQEFARGQYPMRHDAVFAQWSERNELLSYQGALNFLENDLLAPARSLLPELGALIDCLSGVPEFVTQMTGSGSVLVLLPRSPLGGSAETVFRVSGLMEPFGARVIETLLGPFDAA